MSWNPEQQQAPNPSNPYGNYPPASQPADPYSNQQGSYSGQQGYASQQQYGTFPASGTDAYGPSSMGMEPKTAAGLSYVAGWVTGLIFFLLEKRNRFVRFHAMQSILFFGGLSVLSAALGIVSTFSPGVLALAFNCTSGLIGIVGFVGWIVLMINGFQGKYFKLPLVGDYAERYANQGLPG